VSIYIVTAKGSGMTKRTWFHADDDFEATIAAIGRILDKANGMTEPWANGRIELAQNGRLVHVVEAK